MTEINKQTTTESGRSMVEMLGVLAIIGVLSIGGIAGYTHAMNKSKANDILAGVSQRAVVASQQMILSGTPSFVEYAGQKIGDYGVALKTEGYPTDQFGIEISGIEQGVCERLQDQGISNAVKAELGGIGFAEATCAEGEANALTYVFNDVLDPNKVSSGGGNNDNTSECNPACEEGEECIYNGLCIPVSPPETLDECSNNSDCDDWCATNGGGEKCFCQLYSSSSTANTGNYEDYWNSLIGYCRVAKKNNYVPDDYTVSSNYTSWWGAVNFCKAYGKSLVSLSDLGVTGGYQDYDAKCSYSECTGTFTWSDLQNKLGGYSYWVSDGVYYLDDGFGNWAPTSNNNSKHSYIIKTGMQQVYVSDRGTSSSYYAVCK